MATSDATKHLIFVGTGCFVAGWAAHAVFSRKTAAARATGRRESQQPADSASEKTSSPVKHAAQSLQVGTASVQGSENGASVPSTPRDGSSLNGPCNHKMALLVRSDVPLGKGDVGRLCAHAAVLQYKKVLREKSAVRVPWEQEGYRMVCVAVGGTEQLTQHRATAKSQGVHTVAMKASSLTANSAEDVVLVLGPASSADIDKIIGSLRLLS